MKLRITVEPVRARVAPGENLQVRTTYHNDGATVAEVRSPHVASPFTYRLSPVGGGEPVVLSAARKAAGAARGPGPALGTPRQLPPGRTLSLTENLGLWIEKPLRPGPYLLTATLEGAPPLHARPVRIEVAAPRTLAWSSVVCRTTSHLASVLGVKLGDDPPVLLHRDSTPNRPTYCPFWRPNGVQKGAAVTSVATVVKSGEGYSGRWMTWFDAESSAVFAAFVGGEQTIIAPLELPTGLEAPVLIGPGLQRADGSGSVVVLGNVGAERQLRGFRLGPKAIVHEWSVRVPDAVKALKPTAVQYPTDDSTRVVWLWAGAGEQPPLTLAMLSIGERGKSELRLHPTAGVQGHLLATDLSTSLPRPVSWLDALVRVDKQLAYVRYPLEPGVPPEVRGFVSLPPAPGDAFAICASTESGAIVAHALGKLYLTTLGGGSWVPVAQGILEAARLALFHIGGKQHWLEWIEDERGLRLEPLTIP